MEILRNGGKVAELRKYRVRLPYSVAGGNEALDQLSGWATAALEARPNIIDPAVEFDKANGQLVLQFSWMAISSDGALHPQTRIARMMRDLFRNLGVDATPGRASIDLVPRPVAAI